MDVYRKIISCYRMEENPSEIKDLLVITLNVQRFIGHAVLDTNWTPQKHIFKLILATTSICYGIIGCMTFIFSDGVRINDKTESFTLFILAVQAFVKFVTMIHGRHNLRKLFEFNQKIFWPLIRGESGLERNKIKKRLREIIVVQCIFFSFIIITFAAYELSTIMDYLNGDRINMFKSIYTFLPNTFPYFEIGWALQTIFGLQISSTQVCFDIIFTFNMIMGCLVVDVMIKKLEHVKLEKNPMEREKALKCIYKYHVQLIWYLRVVHKLYRVPATSQMVSALGCVTALLLGMESGGVSSFGTIILPAVGQVAVYCWYGQEIKSQGHNLMRDLTMFNWVELNASTRRSFIMITMFMNKELRPGAAGSMDLSLNTMKLVMQHSYQNFAVLRRFKQ